MITSPFFDILIQDNHFQPLGNSVCFSCGCYSVGSYGNGCDTMTGQCNCRPGVIGRRCDSCSNPFAEVTLRGCEGQSKCWNLKKI